MTDATDHPLDPMDAEPLHPLDELASAHVDGVADPIDVAAGQGLPGFDDRLARFAQVRGALRAEAPVDAERREAAIAAALAAFDAQPVIDAPRAQPDEPTEVLPTAAAVTPIPIAAARRRLPGRRWQVAAVAAAAVAAGAIALVPALTSDDKPDDATTLAAPPESSRAAKDGADEDMTFETGMADRGLAATPKLGDFKDFDELEGAVRQRLAPAPRATAASPAPTTSAPPSTTTTVSSTAEGTTGGGGAAADTAPATCSTPPPSGTTSSNTTETSVAYGGEATVDGKPYTVDVTEDQAGQRTMTVRDPESDCHVVEQRDLK
jgi:hypothetical protein